VQPRVHSGLPDWPPLTTFVPILGRSSGQMARLQVRMGGMDRCISEFCSRLTDALQRRTGTARIRLYRDTNPGMEWVWTRGSGACQLPLL
jgi:hypothetical protein